MLIAVPPITNEPRINDRIRAREVLLVDSDGTKLGVRPLPEALQMARDQDLDLVEVAANNNPPVCRIMDYGKFKFDAAQRAKESRRKTTQTQLKQMNYRIKIGQGDFDTKTRKVMEFLEQGHKVKVMVWFRGRETAHPHLGKRIMDQIAERAHDVAKVESEPRLDGRNMVMVLGPDKRAQQAATAKAKTAGNGAATPAATSRESADTPDAGASLETTETDGDTTETEPQEN